MRFGFSLWTLKRSSETRKSRVSPSLSLLESDETAKLTEEWKEDRVVVRHDEQVNAGEGGAGFQVSERLSQVGLLPAVTDKHLPENEFVKPLLAPLATLTFVAYLPAHVRRLPFQNVLSERGGLQLVLVKGKLVDHHGLAVHAGEAHQRVGGARRLREER